MVQITQPNLPSSSPSPAILSQGLFDAGVITVIDESNIPHNALAQADNNMLVEDGAPSPRWGVDWYGTAPDSGNSIDGADLYEASDGSVHLVVIVNGAVWRSTDDGATWTECNGGTPPTITAGVACDTAQIKNYLYITNGTDVIIRYDGTTTLQSYSALTDPTAPSGTASATLTGTTYNYYYKISAVNEVGFTAGSSYSSAIGVKKTRDKWDVTGPDTITLTWSAVSGATRYDVFIATATGDDAVYIATVNGLSYTDTGEDPEIVTVIAPVDNTTTGPKAKNISIIGNRIWLTGDPDHLNRVWWSGADNFVGFFSESYGGGYIDLQPGSQYHPIKAEDYRDGKGNPIATVWEDSADGLGAVWQISLDTDTIGDVSFINPNAYRLPGSRGTSAPNSVTNVLNDFFYYNQQAFYNIGSRAQFLNILSTDEASGNIRPSVRQINSAAASKIAGYYYDSKLFISAPFGTNTTNSQTMILDTAIKAKPWLPKAFDIGFAKFFAYTDTDGGRHLLAYKDGDDKLTEISQNIQGDYAAAFSTSLTTGLISVNPRNRFDLMWVDEALVEFSQPAGKIYIELNGTDRSRGFRSLIVKELNADTETSIGWDTFDWDTTDWDDLSGDLSVTAEPSVKKYFRVSRELNNYQFHITTNTKNANYTLRILQITGTLTQSGHPRTWKL